MLHARYIIYAWHSKSVKWAFIGGIFLVNKIYEKEFLLTENALLC